jgi:hypothetical protein
MPVAAHAVLPDHRARDRPLRTGMRFDPLMPIDRWKAVGARLAAYSDAASWWLGDWMAFGQAKYGRRYKEGIALTGLEYQTLRNYATIARRFDVSRRRDNLSFQHHAEVCSLSDDDQERWLDVADRHGWSKTELRRRVRADAPELETPTGASTVVRLALEPQREQLWRNAAQHDHRDLEMWILGVVDDAARKGSVTD